MSSRLKDAYFTAVVYPVSAAAAMARKILSDSVASHKAYTEIQRLTDHYQQLRDGKWRGLMSAAPRQLPVFSDVCGQVTEDSLLRPAVLLCQASQYDACSDQVESIQMLGHSMSAVSIPKGGDVTYNFTIDKEDDYTLFTAMIPTHPVDNGDVCYAVSVDGQTSVVYNLKEPFRSEQWKENVLRGQARRSQQIHLTKGQHQLVVKALDEHIVLDQWWIDVYPQRHSYLAPSLD